MRTDKLAGLVLYETPVCEGESLTSPDLLERLENLYPTVTAKACSEHSSPGCQGIHPKKSKCLCPLRLGPAALLRHTRCRESLGH